MMLPDTEIGSHEPWRNRKRAMPLQTWCGRVVHDRPRHAFRMVDAERILLRLVPAPAVAESEFGAEVVRGLQRASRELLGRILPFLDATTIGELYQWGLATIDTGLGLMPYDNGQWAAKNLIASLASRYNIPIQFL